MEECTLRALIAVQGIRLKIAMSWAEFAEAFGLDRRTLQQWEEGVAGLGGSCIPDGHRAKSGGSGESGSAAVMVVDLRSVWTPGVAPSGFPS